MQNLNDLDTHVVDSIADYMRKIAIHPGCTKIGCNSILERGLATLYRMRTESIRPGSPPILRLRQQFHTRGNRNRTSRHQAQHPT
jgi:hypothetical protein